MHRQGQQCLQLEALVVLVKLYGLKLLSGVFKGRSLFFFARLTVMMTALWPFEAPATVYPKTQRCILEYVNLCFRTEG